ncbi:hypothetical protein CONLIGDRAFT_124302 [Coniochaeta ligniaria NRRL 30616]|uniref:Uncharacterized protein n=1 Tax=Coniochaeta ligniaria NRRL 30616 TaxID=1408157 RepID=A0A1J7I8V0_9PEZI|nr:hypothetical protein CONLIGDRAFT_124302 [Coniochaeta ligniaria NRRL 30616]
MSTLPLPYLHRPAGEPTTDVSPTSRTSSYDTGVRMRKTDDRLKGRWWVIVGGDARHHASRLTYLPYCTPTQHDHCDWRFFAPEDCGEEALVCQMDHSGNPLGKLVMAVMLPRRTRCCQDDVVVPECLPSWRMSGPSAYLRAPLNPRRSCQQPKYIKRAGNRSSRKTAAS